MNTERRCPTSGLGCKAIGMCSAADDLCVREQQEGAAVAMQVPVRSNTRAVIERMRPTMDLRLVVRVMNQTYPPAELQPAELQQRWINDDASRSEWRVVPQVTPDGHPIVITR